MNKPRIYGTCPAGCLWETVHRDEFLRSASIVKQTEQAEGYVLEAGRTYKVRKRYDGAYWWGFAFGVTFSYLDMVFNTQTEEFEAKKVTNTIDVEVGERAISEYDDHVKIRLCGFYLKSYGDAADKKIVVVVDLNGNKEEIESGYTTPVLTDNEVTGYGTIQDSPEVFVYNEDATIYGATGASIVSTVLKGQNANGDNIYEQVFDNGVTAEFVAPKGDTGDTGAQGKKGDTGAKVVSTVLTGQDENGGNIYKQTFDDGTTAEFVAPKGGAGEKGERGERGEIGATIVANTLIGRDENGGNIYRQVFSDGSTADFTAPKGDMGSLEIVQTTGESETAVMSQKAATDALNILANGEDKTIVCHYDDIFTGGIGTNVYKCSTAVIPKGHVLKKFRYFSVSQNINNAYLFILNSNDVIVDKVELSKTNSNTWNEVELNLKYDVNVYIAVSGGDIGFSHSTVEKDAYYSNGLFEAILSNGKEIGDTISFTHVVPGRYYEFGVEIELEEEGVIKKCKVLDDRINELEKVGTSVSLSDFPLLKVIKTGEEGYSLFGRWYKLSTFDECCNCGGQSILFKIKNATSVSIDIKQLVHPNNPNYVMSVEPYIAYSIDGSEFAREQIGESAINIAIPTTDEHLVWVVVDGMCLNSGNANRNSGWSGVYINSLTTDGKMFKVELRNRQILFVGDSIVEGINTLGTDSTSNSNSAVNEFSFKTARKLNAFPILHGYGGTTSWVGIDIARYSCIDAQSCDFIVDIEPDVIVVEYGYNDNSVISTGAKSVSDFIESYNELLNILIGQYTGVPIICLIPFKQSLANEIREIAKERSYCYVVETADYDVTYSDTAHPNVEGAKVIAEELSKDIEDIFTKNFFM